MNHLKQTYTCVRHAPTDPWDVRIDRTTPVFSTSPPTHTHTHKRTNTYRRNAHGLRMHAHKIHGTPWTPYPYYSWTPLFRLNFGIQQMLFQSDINYFLQYWSVCIFLKYRRQKSLLIVTNKLKIVRYNFNLKLPSSNRLCHFYLSYLSNSYLSSSVNNFLTCRGICISQNT